MVTFWIAKNGQDRYICSKNRTPLHLRFAEYFVSKYGVVYIYIFQIFLKSYHWQVAKNKVNTDPLKHFLNSTSNYHKNFLVEILYEYKNACKP